MLCSIPEQRTDSPLCGAVRPTQKAKSLVTYNPVEKNVLYFLDKKRVLLSNIIFPETETTNATVKL